VALKKVSYGTTKIQTLRRVALDPNLLRTLGLDIGDSVHIELDTEHEAVLITRVLAGSSPAAVASSNTRRPRAKR
jgi:hypothetical protein